MYLVAQIAIAALLSAAIVVHGRRLHRSPGRTTVPVPMNPRNRPTRRSDQ